MCSKADFIRSNNSRWKGAKLHSLSTRSNDAIPSFISSSGRAYALRSLRFITSRCGSEVADLEFSGSNGDGRPSLAIWTVSDEHALTSTRNRDKESPMYEAVNVRR
jgi:hypothetical protein